MGAGLQPPAEVCGRCGCPWHTAICVSLRHSTQECPEAVTPQIFANIQLSQIGMLMQQQNATLEFIAQSVDPERALKTPRIHSV